MMLAILPVFGPTTIYVEAKTTMTIDSKVEDGDIRTEIEIDTPDATRIDETETKGDDKVNIVIKSPNKDNGNKEAQEENRDAREKLQDTRDKLDQLDDALRDKPNSEPSEEVQDKVDDADSDITEACEEQDAPCSEPS